MSHHGSCMPEGAFCVSGVLRCETVGGKEGGDTAAKDQDVSSITPDASPNIPQVAQESIVERHGTECWEETNNPPSQRAHSSWVFSVQLVRVSKEAHSKDVVFNQRSSLQREHPVLVHLVQSLGQPRQVISTRENRSRQMAHPVLWNELLTRFVCI